MPFRSTPLPSAPPPRLLARRLGGAVCVLCLCGAGSVSAQGETGKLEGLVTDGAGSPIGSASIFLVGSAFAAMADPRGHYFINNIPAGTWSVRAIFLGHRPVQVDGLRIVADQTVTQSFTLAAAPLILREITVVAAENLLVPRDEVTTKQRIDGGYADALPIDRVEALLTLQPGVVEANGPQGLSIRGGRPDQAVTYLDGIPVSPGYRGFGFGTPGTQVTVGTNGLEEAAVLTGATSAEFGNTQSGVVSLVTRTGESRLSGALGFESDAPFGVDHSLGFSRLQVSLSGPLVNRLTFAISGVLEGQSSAPAGAGAEFAPVFLPVGADTVVRQPRATDDPATATVDEGLLADTTLVTVSRFAVSRGRCDAFRQSVNPGIRDNYGFACQGIRTPASGSSTYQLQGRLSYSYGSGSRVGVTYAASRNQNRLFDYENLFNPVALLADQNASRILTLSWAPNLRRSSERALALETYLSYQQDRTLTGPLTGESERATRTTFGATHLRPFEFVYDFESFPLTESLLANVLSAAAGGRRSPTPFPEQNQLVDVYRNDPYGLTGWSESGGPIGAVRLLRESRYLAKVNLDWQADRYNRLKVGGEFTRYDLARYQSRLDVPDIDFYLERPIRWSAFVENRLDLGDLVLAGGLRYDSYSSRATRPFLLDTTAGSPTFRRYLQGFDAAYSGTFDGLTLAIHRSDRTHGYLSPHIQVAFPVTTRTNFRFSYAHQVQAPDFAAVLRDVNFGGLGTDLDFGKTIVFEFGIRHAFSDDMVLDLAAYNKDDRADPAFRTVRVTNVVSGLRGTKTFVTNLDYGTTRGIDVRLDRRVGTLFNGTLAYGYQASRNTGSDPGSNFARGVAALAEPDPVIGAPPQAIVPTSFSRPHSLTGAAAFTLPARWKRGTLLGALLGDIGMFATFRYVSGTAYTQCAEEAGTFAVLSGEGCAGLINRTRLPPFRQLDLRVTKGFGLGRLGVTLYLDARNLLDIRNIVQVYARTGATASPLEAAQAWASDSSLFANEAVTNEARAPDGSIELGFGGLAASGCGGWLNAGATPAVPNCVYLIRAEERYGDGDHVFTVEEQRRASAAAFQVDRGIQQFTGDTRRVRLGLEVTF